MPNKNISSSENRDIPPELQFEIFMKAFEGERLENSDGLTVILAVRKSSSSTQTKDLNTESSRTWVIEFKDFPGETQASGNRTKKDTEENYAKFTFEPTGPTVVNRYSRLTDSKLRGKGIYPQIRNLIGRNFPPKFKLYAEIDNERNKQAFLDLKTEYNNKNITGQELKDKLLNHYLVKQWTDAGFNYITVNYQYDEIVELTMEKEDGETKIFVTEEGKIFIN